MSLIKTYLFCQQRKHIRNSVLCPLCKSTDYYFCDESVLFERDLSVLRDELAVVRFGEQPMFEGMDAAMFEKPKKKEEDT